MKETIPTQALPKKIRVSFDFDEDSSWQLVDQLREKGIEIIPTPVRALTDPETYIGTRKLRGVEKIREHFGLTEQDESRS